MRQRYILAQESFQNNFFDTEYLKADLKGRSVRGGAITVFAQGCRFVLRMGSTVVLARLLTPADFGLIAMVAAVTNFGVMFKDMGLSMATVQKADINHSQISTLFWINVAVGIAIAGLLAALAPLVAGFYGDPRLTPVTMALAGVFIFGGLTVQHQALLRRHMRFFRLGVVEISAMAAGVAAAIIAGVYGAGYWSLVIMHIVLAVATAAGMWIAFPWRPGLPKRHAGVRKMLFFGGNLTGFNLVNYFARNADNILIGKFFGSAAVGFYSKAYGLLMMPIRQVRNPLTSVGIPSLSRLQREPQRYKNYYLKMLQMLAFITIPMALLLCAYSHQIIMLVLGPQWEQTVGLFRILAFAAIIQPVAGTVGMVMLSSGHASRYFKVGVFTSVLYVISFTAGLPWGARGVALSYTIANYILLAPTLMYSFNYTPVRVRDFLEFLFLPFIASLIMVLASKIIFYFCTDLVEWIALVIGLFTAVLFYLMVYMMLPAGRNLLKDIKVYGKFIFKAG